MIRKTMRFTFAVLCSIGWLFIVCLLWFIGWLFDNIIMVKDSKDGLTLWWNWITFQNNC